MLLSAKWSPRAQGRFPIWTKPICRLSTRPQATLLTTSQKSQPRPEDSRKRAALQGRPDRPSNSLRPRAERLEQIGMSDVLHLIPSIEQLSRIVGGAAGPAFLLARLRRLSRC